MSSSTAALNKFQDCKSMKETAVSHSHSNAHSRHKLMAEMFSKELGDGSSHFVKQLKIAQTSLAPAKVGKSLWIKDDNYSNSSGKEEEHLENLGCSKSGYVRLNSILEAQ
jgi:hypothetical protein